MSANDNNFIKINAEEGDLSEFNNTTVHNSGSIKLKALGFTADSNNDNDKGCFSNVILDSTGMEITSEGAQILIKNNFGITKGGEENSTDIDNSDIAGEVVIQNKNNTILISPRSGVAYDSGWDGTGGIQMTGNVHCTNFLTSGSGIETKGDCHVANYVHCKNLKWLNNEGKPDIDHWEFTDAYWAICEIEDAYDSLKTDYDKKVEELGELQSRFNNHTHRFYVNSAKVSGQAIAQGVYLQGVNEQGNVVGPPIEGTEALNQIKKFRYGVILRTRDMDYEDDVEVFGTSSTPI